jgi:hypothetical protein
MLAIVPLLNNNNFSNTALAQGYNDNDYGDNSNYSQYPTDHKKYECRTGPFEGFFVSSVEFCKHVKFDDKKDRDTKVGPQGPPGATGAIGPQGIQGIQGETGPAGEDGSDGAQGLRGFNGTQGPPGPSGVVNATNTYVVWADNTPGNSEIFFRASQSLGTINISNNTGESGQPQIALSGNNVYVTWADRTPGINFDIFFAVSIDNGQTFSTPINLSNNTGSSTQPQIAVSGNNVYVVWADNTPGNFDIFFATSIDNGQTFSTINLSNNTGDSFASQISVSGNNVYVTWADETPGNRDIFFAVSIDNGQSFSTPINISNTAGFSTQPQIAASGNNVYVTWEDRTPGNPEIFFAVSIDNGQTFSTPINLSNNTGGSTEPQIAVSGTNVYVTWIDNTPGNFNIDIFFAVSIDNGQSFSTPINLSNNTGLSSQQQIAASGNNVYIVWTDSTPGNNDILFATSNDNGQSFNTINISNNAGGSFQPQIALSGNNVYVTWADATPGNSDIFVISNDRPFGTPINLSNNAGSSSTPQIAAAS